MLCGQIGADLVEDSKQTSRTSVITTPPGATRPRLRTFRVSAQLNPSQHQGHNRLQEQPPLETLFISGSVSDLFQVVSTASTSIREAGKQHLARRDRKRAQRQQLACALKARAELYSPSHHLQPAQ